MRGLYNTTGMNITGNKISTGAGCLAIGGGATDPPYEGYEIPRRPNSPALVTF